MIEQVIHCSFHEADEDFLQNIFSLVICGCGA
jgi:hypothetical protein